MKLRCHETCPNIDFHKIDSGGESHGSCDWAFIMTERCIGCEEHYAAHVLLVCQIVRCWRLASHLARGGCSKVELHFQWCSSTAKSQLSG